MGNDFEHPLCPGPELLFAYLRLTTLLSSVHCGYTRWAQVPTNFLCPAFFCQALILLPTRLRKEEKSLGETAITAS